MSHETFLRGEEVELVPKAGDAPVMADLAEGAILSVEKDNGETVELQLLDKQGNVIGAACFPKNRLQRKMGGFVN